MVKKGLHEGHRSRLRNRFLTSGSDAFFDHELLELLLFYAIPRINTNETAHRLVNKFGDFDGVMSANAEELAGVKGMGKSSAEFLILISELCDEIEQISTDVIPDDPKQYISEYFRNSNTDVCLLLMVDYCGCIRGQLTFRKSTFLMSECEQLNLAHILIKSDAETIYLGINHGNRSPIPEHSDFVLTKLLAERYKMLNVRLADTLICGEGITFSLREKGAFSF